MPIYIHRCESCGLPPEEILQAMDAAAPTCLSCGDAMTKQPTCHAFVFMKGRGGYPSFRKKHLGTAPGTTRKNGHDKGGPGSPVGKQQGQAWLESIE